MKRTLLSLLAALPVMYVSAAVTLPPVGGIISADESAELLTVVPGCDRPAAPAVFTGSSVDPDNWEELGQGCFRDDIMRSAFELPFIEFYARIQGSVHTPGLYRIVNPYQQYPISANDLHNDNNLEDWNFMIVHAEDPDHVWFENFSTGLSVDGLGTIRVISQAASLIGNYGFEYVRDNIPSVFGKLENDVITYPAKCEIEGKEYYNMVVEVDQMPGTYVGVNLDGLFTYAMPGVMFPPLPESAVKYGYKDLGTGSFTDGILATRADLTPAAVSVHVYENMAFPGYLLVKGAWAQTGSEALFQIDAGDPEYVLIPPQDPAFTDANEGKTYIVSHSYEELHLVPYPTYKDDFIAQFGHENITHDGHGLITFPKGSVRYNWPASTDPTTFSYVWYTSGRQQASQLQYNPLTAVEDVDMECADAPVRYFNLQGMEVRNPAKGEMLIRCQGGKSVKVIY